MASPRVAKQFASPPPTLPGQGQNVALEALEQSADRQVQRDQITAQMQIEAMRAGTDAAKMQVAAAQDLGRGITEASQAFATQAENKRVTDVAVQEAQKARDSQAKRERTQQASSEKIQTDHDAANKVNRDADRALASSEKSLDRKDLKDTNNANLLHVRLDHLTSQLGDPTGVPKDPEKAADYIANLERQAAEVNEQLNEVGFGQSKTQLERGFNIMAASLLARRTTALGKKEFVERVRKAEVAREKALNMKKVQLKVQLPRFEQQEAWRIIDAGVGKVPPHEKALQLLMNLAQVDLSNPKAGGQGAGLVQALAMNEGKPANLLNQVMAKLGPHGMATTDALGLVIQGFHKALGEAPDEETRNYRKAVIADAGNMAAILPRQTAYSAIQNGYSMDTFGTWFNDFRDIHGEPPTEQESHNYIRGIDASHLPGNLNIGKLFALPSANQRRFEQLRSGARLMGEGSPEEQAAEQAEALSAQPASVEEVGPRAFGRRGGKAVRGIAGETVKAYAGGAKNVGKGAVSTYEALRGFGQGVAGQ